ncbi:long-chain-fatty-acid--CoA ligase 5 [Aplysia californica]|uniref:Long-chain-fatty-acid--CoA ligase n=1 Tax=Aplysia californica TaxID=6500 RepID=A0ABM0JJK7_APLCA|nr:long-chain-fatty-acid--CoA ligase 5 [Aplysia californica]
MAGVREFWEQYQTVLGAGAATLAGLAALSYMTSNGTPVETIVDLNNQSVVIDGKPEHRGSRLARRPDYITCDRPAPDVETCFAVLAKGLRMSGNGPCLGTRTGPNKEYEWISFQEVIDRINQFGSGLVGKGAVPSNETRVGIFSANRPEWCIADFGCQAFSMVPVPIYDTLGLPAVKYILTQCEIELVMCDTAQKVTTLLSLKSEVACLKTVVVVENVGEKVKAEAKQAGVDVVTFADIQEIGKKNPQPPNPPKPEDMFSIMYTSGTTGNPKGVVVTQRAFVSMVRSMTLHTKGVYQPTPDDVHLSYLPLAHNYERGLHVFLLMHGARIGYFSRDIKLLTNDLATLRPTLFPSVPRLLNRIYDAVQTEVKKSSVRTMLFNWAMASKKKDVDNRIYRRDTIWDKLIFQKIQQRLGGRVRIVLSGSAPLSEDVMNFLRCALGCFVVEGYGQTEVCAAATMNFPGDASIGNVGPPLPGVHIKLLDVPEMDYYAKENMGEVCLKSDFVFTGYFKDPEKTRETLDDEGWLHTGDIGTWLPNGCLKIVDRRKNIFKLAQGEYIATEKIESIYMNSPFTAQCFVDGDSLKTCVMAVVVPDEAYISVWGPKNGFPGGLKEFCAHKDAKHLILKDILSHGKANGLKGFEQVRDIVLELEMWTVENDLITPTFKNKRPALRKKYKETIANLYISNGL